MLPCKLSLKGIEPSGYSKFSYKGKAEWAHRVAWIEANGPIPDGMEVCHYCDVRNCIEPTHLFLGTHTDNMKDASNKKKLSKGFKKTHCIRGHEFTPENTYTYPTGSRRCRTCDRAREMKRFPAS